MLSKKMEQAINEQINREMFSGYLYMAMSAQSSIIGLKGVASWFMVQYHEEMFHAMKMYEYVLRQGGTINLKVIDMPQGEYKSVKEMFEKTLNHEKEVTRYINALVDLAIEEKDHASQAFFSWYVTEQVEEEENPTDVLQKLKFIGDNMNGIFMLDAELGARAVTIPVDFSKGVQAAMGA